MTVRVIGYIGAISVVMAAVGLLCKAPPLIEFAVAGVISAADLAAALVLLLPLIFCAALPLASAIAIACTYESWAVGNELLTLRVIGLRDRTLALPALVGAGAALLFTASLSLYLLPISFRLFEDIRYSAIFNAALSLLGDGYPQTIAPKVSFSFRHRIGADEFEGVTILDGRSSNGPKFVLADRAYLLRSVRTEVEPMLVLHRGSYRTLDEHGEIVQPVGFDELTLDLFGWSGLPRSRGWRGHYEEHLWRLLDPPEEVGANPSLRELWLAEGHRRIILPLLCPSFSIFTVGMMLAFGERRVGAMSCRLLGAIGGVCAWYGLLIAVDAIMGRTPLVTLTYYGLAILPGIVGLLIFASESSSWWRDSRIARFCPMNAALKSVGCWPLRWLVHRIDAGLRRILAIIEIESDHENLFRIKLGPAEREIFLSDGTCVRPGDTVLELHFWNEKLGLAPAEHSELDSALRLRWHVLASLRSLATHMQAEARLAAVRAIHAQPAIERQRSAGSMERLLPKGGFEQVPAAPPRHLYRFLENIWLWLLTWAHNPRALRGRQFDRARRGFWISRSQFIARYAAALTEQRAATAKARPR